MKQMTLKEYNKIHKDYKGKINGKRTYLGLGPNGTEIKIEGIDFEIVKSQSKKIQE